MKMMSLKLLCVAAGSISMTAFTNAPAGTIGGTNIDWGAWMSVSNLPAVRNELAAGTLNNRLYAIGGLDSSGRTNVYRYDGTNWTEVAGLPAARYVLAAGVLNNALYAVGGGNSGYNATTNVYRYDGTN